MRKLGVRNFIHELNDLKELSSIMPFSSAWRLFFQMRNKKNGIYKVNLEKWKSPILLRDNISDKAIFRQVFTELQYKPVLDFITHADNIIDAGANVGMASIYFSILFPNAKIFSIEPDPDNFKVLVENVTNDKNIVPIQAGVWSQKTMLSISNPEVLAAGREVAEDNSGNIETVTINELVEKMGGWVDILKIDIEGAEKKIFENGFESWLGKVRLLIIELHDKEHYGSGMNFVKAISKYKFSLFSNHENLFVLFK